MSSSRQLAAIMFTDIVGYTALMGKDSAKALELVRISKEIQKPLVEKHHGQWLKEMGDGALVKFSTALDALNCAIEIQELARAKFDGKLRIGIHLGDITIENNDVYGDGVNVASRLESIADPGGIYISDNVEKSIRGQTDVQAKYLGEVNLKNVDYGVRTYAIQGVGLPVPEVKEDKELSGHFWAEVQRRGVLQAGAAYVVLSLLLILLLPYASSLVNLPVWSSTALLGILIAGFPAALYLAWNFERSPEGFVKTTSQQSWQNPLKASQRKPLTGSFVIGGLVVVIVLMYVYRNFQSSGQNTESSESNSKSIVPDKSIAVLPFADLSPNKDQEYFSVGMMDEILNHLVKIKDLRVTSRTSVMQYSGTIKTIKEISRELGVTNILEGSVRKAGNKVRITVQLINAKTDDHLWSQTYDRDFDDIFVIQSDVAQRIANVLQVDIFPEVKLRIESQPTESLEAYNLWLEGNFLWRPGNEGKSKEHWEKAIQADPNFAHGYASLAWYWLNSGGFTGSQITRDELVREVSYHAERAIELDPDNPAPHSHLLSLYLWYEWDFKMAEKEFRLFAELSPSSSSSVGVMSFLSASGRFKEAIKQSELYIANDVNNPAAWAVSGLNYYLSGQIDMGNSLYDMALNLFPQGPNRWYLDVEVGRGFIYAGRYEKTIEVLTGLLEISPKYRFPRVLSSLAMAYYHLDQLNEAQELLEEIMGKVEESPAGSPSFYSAMVYAQMGEPDVAFEWLENAYEEHQGELYWLKEEPTFEPLYSDPRWQVMLDKVGFPE